MTKLLHRLTVLYVSSDDFGLQSRPERRGGSWYLVANFS